MAIITEVRFAHEDGALADTLAALPALEATVIREAGTDPGHSIDLVRFEGERVDDVVAALETDHTVAAVTQLPGLEDSRLLGIEFEADARLLAPEVTSRDGFVLEARSAAPGSGTGSVAGSESRGWYERWLLPDGDALHDIWQHARAADFEFEVVALRQPGQSDPGHPGPDALTDQQREALVAAYEQGYYAEPRETSLEELADSLDLSATAVAGRLKRGMRSLVGISLVLDEHGEGPS